MIFGQQNAYSAPWLAARLGQSASIEVEDFPHVAALRGDHALFLDYLAASWRMFPRKNTPARRAAHLAAFLAHPESAESISTLTRPDGRRMVVDGNHRVAWAHVEGTEPRSDEMPLDLWLARTTQNDAERYGTAPGRPYQSVYADGAELVIGRRRDTLARHAMLDPGDLTGSVLDIGCNIGAASLLAARTAARVLGVDVSPRMVTAANRLGAYLASSARFAVADVGAESFKGWDTVLCFAVLAHVPDRVALRKTLTSARVVYIEENGGREQFAAVRPWFAHVDRIDGGFRTLYRCEP